MNPKFYHKIPADFMTGKAILILIVTLCSAFSFLLGYFVGKSQMEPPPALMSMNTLTVPDEKARDISLQDKSLQADDLLPTPAIESRKNKDTPPALAAKAGAGKEKIYRNNSKGSAERTPGKKKTEVRKKTSLYYTIQVGAFRNKQQAEKLKNQLKRKGYSVKVTSAGKNRTLYRVWVGRFKARKSAETAAIKLTRAEKLKTLVLKTER
ncbi:MAG: SPOR domain-containing protein [Nitrospirota bacterium]|nr:SPOR domain-containing protein [Nitrospirota bacterium]